MNKKTVDVHDSLFVRQLSNEWGSIHTVSTVFSLAARKV